MSTCLVLQGQERLSIDAVNIMIQEVVLKCRPSRCLKIKFNRVNKMRSYWG